MIMSNESSHLSSSVDIPVWINGSEKLVTGIAKTTTCDDVIYSLLCNDGVRHAEVESLNYVIVERWHKVERPLSGRAKLGKVWRAWGPETANVRLYVRRIDVPTTGTSLKVKQRHRHKRRPQDKEFFDPEKVRAEKSRLQTIEDLVQLVSEQQRKLKEQADRITETDRAIDNIENDVHLNRLKERGLNYVQDSVFMSPSDDSSGLEDMNVALTASDFDNYLDLCDRVLDLDQQIHVHKSEGERLENCIKTQEEERTVNPLKNCKTDEFSEVSELKEKIDNLKSGGEKLDREIYRVRTQITDRDILIRRKQEYVDRLVQELAECDKRESVHSSPDSGKGTSPERRTGTLHERRTCTSPERRTGTSPERRTGTSPEKRTCTSPERRTSSDRRTETTSPERRSAKQVTFQLPSRDDMTFSLQNRHVFNVMNVTVNKPLSHAYSCGDLDRITKTSGILKYPDSDSNSDTGLSSLHSDEMQVVLETLV